MVKRLFSGLLPWLLQRLSAVYLLAFGLFLLTHFLTDAPASHAEWRAWILGGGVREFFLLFLMALFLHAWIGLRDVILDYVHPPGLRLALLSLIGLGLLLMTLWAVGMLLLTPA